MKAVLERPQTRGRKAPQDTAAGCRSRAEADLLASAAMVLANQRLVFETSAANWTARADLLESIEVSFVAPQAAAGPPTRK